MNTFIHKCKKVVKYLISPKEYYKGIQICGWGANFFPQFVADRMKFPPSYGRMASFNTYSVLTILHYHCAPIKLFFTQENTHVQGSTWQQFENIWQKEPSLSLTCGFDYAEHPKYLRFPYWLEHVFGPMATRESITEFVKNHNYSDSTNRGKKCAFICKKDYFGDRAIMADMVADNIKCLFKC